MKILFKDKSDVDDSFQAAYPDSYFVGAMEKKTPEMDECEILSVKFTKVGATALKSMKNLKWVVVRAHGVDTINLDLCKKANVGVITCAPTSTEVAMYIADKVKQGPICFYGFGNIAQATAAMTLRKFCSYTTTQTPTKEQLAGCKTLVVTAAPNTKTHGAINKKFLKQFPKGLDVISISRAELHDNESLLEVVDHLGDCWIDTLGADHRDELIAAGVKWTKHTAWEFKYSQERYLAQVEKSISSLLDGNPVGVVLPRIENDIEDIFD